nr:hypothetical protein HK105_007490 [Polyrhizophydium stewartii]
MKQVQWTKLSAEKVKSSIWKDIGVNAAAEDAIRREKLDLKELETMFCNGGTGASAATLDDAGGESRASNARATDTKTPESDSPAKLKTVTVLDPKRSNNVSIMLGRVKLSYVEIREALIRMEEGKISETLIKQLQVNKPTPEDIELIKEFTGGNEQKLVELGKAEQFLWEINKVPRLDQRLNILNYKLKFHDRLQESRPQIEAVIEASSQLKDNKKIARLLQIILALGNYMNADSAAKGGAFGFTLDSLTKLIDVKSADRKTSLLNYVVSTIDQKFPDLADLGIAGVVHERASKVSLVTISQEIGELVRGMEGLERELKQPDSNVKGDMIKTYTETFIKENKPSLESLSSRHKLMEEMFKKTIEYYGEDPSTTPAFFGIFSTFLLHVDRARKENIKLEVMNNKTSEKSSKQAEKEQEKRKLKENVSKVLNSDNKQIMDDLISALKKGDHFKVAPRVPSHGGLHPGAADSDGPRPRPTRLPPPLPLPKA